MTIKRKLPLVAEQSFGNLKRIRTQLSGDFERELQQTAASAGAKVSCKVGCAHCCYHPVLITALEGVLLYRWLAAHGRWTPSFQARIREHAAKTKDLAFEVWFLSVLPCPLLDETTKRCTAYAARPYLCRVTYSLGEPENCHPHKIEQSGLVNKQAVMQTFHAEQSKIVRKHGLQMVLMPLSAAILIGEKVHTGQIELEGADLEILRQFGDIQ